jgi:recombination protein RecA
MRLGDAHALKKIEVIPTGALAVDLALGVGGVPRGRVIEIFGPESSGKTTLMLHVIANAQKAGGSRPSLTRNTRSTRPTPKNSA